jgi:hypothetical protein
MTTIHINDRTVIISIIARLKTSKSNPTFEKIDRKSIIERNMIKNLFLASRMLINTTVKGISPAKYINSSTINGLRGRIKKAKYNPIRKAGKNGLLKTLKIALSVSSGSSICSSSTWYLIK